MLSTTDGPPAATPSHPPPRRPRNTFTPQRSTEERNALAEANVALVYWFLKRRGVHQRHRHYDDLAQDCHVGLLKAAAYFDEAKARPFAPFAVRCISQAYRQGLRRLLLFRIPQRVPLSEAELPGAVPLDEAPPLSGRTPRPSARMEGEEQGAAISDALARLEQRRPYEALVCRLRMQGLTLCEVGEQIGKTTERARQIQEAGAAWLRRQPELA